ncbi:hypothetical protein PPL_02787 [Heterostelium album PN500]|uniref:Right handed beta helix domain-containing protein n=1 Tax=Heterostelium pallidum (strain ATCC 26659 / Pp 5 / PN500) TaxID=670386 RepID=D3B322_HETP5|nr:hypothetical protein PPL_02787 [Heterostelium album PN500]EFA83720.1 hypothetical protein PPL_02787 [Heterostelium album PN500]|eukprot:XP_020435837.1 hypothetical protein PPL_02787 [Heterostelium album PN500]
MNRTKVLVLIIVFVVVIDFTNGNLDKQDISTVTCVLSNSKVFTQCQDSVCPSIISCIRKYESSYSNINIHVENGYHICKQTTDYKLKHHLHIDIRPLDQSSLTKPIFTCQRDTSFLRLKTTFDLTINISNIVVDTNQLKQFRGSLITIDAQSSNPSLSLYHEPNSNVLTLNNVVLNNANSMPSIKHYYTEAGSITLDYISLIINNCTINNSQSTGGISSLSVMKIKANRLMIRHSTISNSQAFNGLSGIYFKGKDLEIFDTVFDGNSMPGTSFFTARTYNASVTFSRFSNNKVKYGGCLVLHSDSVLIDSNVFDRNHGESASALLFDSRDTENYLTNNSFTNNFALEQGTLYIGSGGNHYLNGSIFDSNIGKSAVDIYFGFRNLTMFGGTFINTTTISNNQNLSYPQFPEYALNMTTTVPMMERNPDLKGGCPSDFQTIQLQNGNTTCLKIHYTNEPEYVYEEDDESWRPLHYIALLIIFLYFLIFCFLMYWLIRIIKIILNYLYKIIF